MNGNQICGERLYLNKDKSKLVPHGHDDAAFLYASPGDEIPESAAERFGLKDGKLPKRKEGGTPPNKERDPGKTKGKPGKGKPTPPAPPAKPAAAPALTDIAGIGQATADRLAAAGIADVAALAKIDAASPPQVEQLPPNFDWAATVAAAGKLVPAEPAPANQDA